jgi:hypothetical protein
MRNLALKFWVSAWPILYLGGLWYRANIGEPVPQPQIPGAGLLFLFNWVFVGWLAYEPKVKTEQRGIQTGKAADLVLTAS